MRLARPSGVKLVITAVDAAIEALNSGVTDKYSLFIITETIEEDVYKRQVLAQVAAGVLEQAAQLARHAGLRVLQHDEFVGLQALGSGVAHHLSLIHI